MRCDCRILVDRLAPALRREGRRAGIDQPALQAHPARGFTLVELLVVILIIGALMMVALPRYFNAVYNARVRGCQAQIQIVNSSCEAFFGRNRVWPATVEEMCESTAPSWVVAPPLTEVPTCPFGFPYELQPMLQDGSQGVPPSPGNPQVGVTLNTAAHFDGGWKSAKEHK